MVQSPLAYGDIKLSYTQHKPGYKRVEECIHSFDERLKRLDEIQHGRKSDLLIGVNLEDGLGYELAVGLGDSKWTVLYYNPEHTELVYSVGDANAQGDVELRFEQWEILPWKYFIPREKAVEVIRTWFATGELSKTISWERNALIPDGW